MRLPNAVTTEKVMWFKVGDHRAVFAWKKRTGLIKHVNVKIMSKDLPKLKTFSFSRVL